MGVFSALQAEGHWFEPSNSHNSNQALILIYKCFFIYGLLLGLHQALIIVEILYVEYSGIPPALYL